MAEYPDNPILFVSRRGQRVESVHRGACAVWEGGKIAESIGSVSHSYFLRSTAKPFQLLAFLEEGGAERFGWTDAEIALACGSHNGEDVHRDTARSMLAKGGFGESDLRCGTHAPFDAETAARLKAEGAKADPLRHNCSGKHVAMLSLARILGEPAARYLDPSGQTQLRIRASIARICGLKDSGFETATDGCSAPTAAIPLGALAAGFGRLARPEGLPSETAEACRRIFQALGREPYVFAGGRQFDTEIVQASGGRILGKRGAEGMYALAVAEKGVGIALKTDDGSNRMHPLFLLRLLSRRGLLNPEAERALAARFDPIQRNFAGLEVGEFRAVLPQ